MYNYKDSIDKAYNFIQERVRSGYKYSGTPIYNVSKSDLEKLYSITSKYGIPFEWMVNLIKHESAGTFNPSITNSIGATGLIQFMTKIGGKTMTYAKADGSSPVGTDKLRKMNFSQQLDYVDGFLYRSLKKHLTPDGKIPNHFTQGDVFMTIFYPVAVGEPDYIFPDSVSKSNGGIRQPKDYVEKALKNAIFTLDSFPYTIDDFKKKIGDVTKETFDKTVGYTKRNWIPITLILVGITGVIYFSYFYKGKGLNSNFKLS